MEINNITIDNVTKRRPRTYSESNIHNISAILSQTLDDTYSSLPDLSSSNIENFLKLKERIDYLEKELQIANKEIESLCLENQELKRNNEMLSKKNDLLKIIAHTPIKNKQVSKNIKTCNEHTQTDFAQNKVHMNTITKENKQSIVVQTAQSGEIIKTRTPIKMCIISANKNNNMLTLAENNVKNYSNICHFLKPNSKISELLKGLDIKLKDYTLNDYCVIFIGDEDFKETNDYLSLIVQIRQITSKIKHTNILLVAPTYKCGKYRNMFNWRVEHFNNLLYLDVMTHEHAYLIDSNRYLNYDYTMFSRVYGHVNNLGMQIIFKNINNYIDDIMTSTNQILIQTLDNNSNLFRD